MDRRETLLNDPSAPSTAEARKKRDQAAFRAGAPYVLFPSYSAALPLLASGPWLRLSFPLALALVVGWMILVGCVLAFGVSRIRKYKRDHPLPE